jgi:phosphatidylinositol glycan class B
MAYASRFLGVLLEGEEGEKVEIYLRGVGYKEVWRDGNGWEEDERRRGGVRVWKWVV